MKRIWMLSVVALLTMAASACGAVPLDANPTKTAEKEVANEEKSETSFTTEELPFTLYFTPEIGENCDIYAAESGEVWFSLQNDGEQVAWVGTTATTEFTENLGLYPLAEQDGTTVWLQMPTCGTLNDESSRELWDSMKKAVAEQVSASFKE